MYYLFTTKRKREAFKKEYERVYNSIEKGTTPVFSELRNARTCLLELFPFSLINGAFLIVGTLLISHLKINELLKVAIVLLINNICMTAANCLYTFIKHWLRIRFLKKLNYPTDEKHIAVLESLEFQTV